MRNQFEFGPFVVNARERQLTRAGEVVHLQPKAFDVLLYLLEHSGKLVTKQEVMDAVWKQAIVTENSLTACIRQIRIALDDHAEAPEYIETVPVSGYRFIAPVHSPDLGLSMSPAQGSLGGRGWGGILGVAIIVLAILGYQYWARTGVEPEAPDEAGWQNSIAVLPFVNMSEDPDNEILSDGIAEEILILLAKIPNLKVIGRASSFAFKDSNEDLRVIGDKLGVKTLLDGSVRKSGDRLRISVQLIDAGSGAQIWSESYDRMLTDIFVVQDDVASAVFEKLHMTVGNVPSRGRPTESPEAYVLYLRARNLIEIHRGLEGAALLRQATALDPNFAEAYELEAFAYWSVGGMDISVDESFERLRGPAARALEIDPGLTFAQALSLLPAGGSEHRLALLAALELAWRDNPVNWAPLRMLIYELETVGYLREAHEYAQLFINYDPLSPVANYSLGETLYAIGKVDEAFEYMTWAYERNERFALWFLPGMHIVEGNYEEVIALTVAQLQEQGMEDTGWVRKVVEDARDPQVRAILIEDLKEQVFASMPDAESFTWHDIILSWTLYFGFLDSFYEVIAEQGPNQNVQTYADVLFWLGTVFRRTGFMSHPKYLDTAVMLGIPEIWKQRGPPDFCSHANGQWQCD